MVAEAYRYPSCRGIAIPSLQRHTDTTPYALRLALASVPVFEILKSVFEILEMFGIIFRKKMAMDT